MQAKQVTAIIIASVVLALAVGVTIGYSFSSRASTTSTETVESASTVVVVQPSMTTVTVKSYPDTVVVNGTVETQSFEPVEVAFRVCYYGNLSGILGSEFCGNKNYSSPVVNIRSWNISINFGGPQMPYFNGTYSIQLPNNATYDVYLVITDPHETPIAYEKFDVVRLPVYSDVQNISNYDIGCLYEGAGNSFYYCIAA